MPAPMLTPPDDLVTLLKDAGLRQYVRKLDVRGKPCQSA